MTSKAAELLRQELCRTSEALSVHRAHAVYFVLRGYDEIGIARMFDVDPRTLRRWVLVFSGFGMSGLVDAQRLGRRARLTNSQWKDVQRNLTVKPVGPVRGPASRLRSAMSGDALAAYLKGKFGIVMSVRQCQRLIAKARKLRNAGFPH